MDLFKLLQILDHYYFTFQNTPLRKLLFRFDQTFYEMLFLLFYHGTVHLSLQSLVIFNGFLILSSV